MENNIFDKNSYKFDPTTNTYSVVPNSPNGKSHMHTEESKGFNSGQILEENKNEDIRIENIDKKNTMLFLGAGASKSFGVPDMLEFISKIKNEVNINNDVNVESLLNKIINNKNTIIDIEHVLSMLNDIISGKIFEHCEMLNGNKAQFEESNKKEFINNAKKLRNIIVRTIKNECVGFKRKEVVKVYNKLFEKISNYYDKLYVSTVNYDTCFEYFASVNKFELNDGFNSAVWNPNELETDKGKREIKYIKLHGSVIWKKHDRNIIKMDAHGDNMKSAIDGKELEDLIIFPTEVKEIYKEPFIELILKFRTYLRNNIQVLVVIGYSFRDDMITNIITEALFKNTQLIMIIIDPLSNKYKKELFGERLIVDKVYTIEEYFG